MGIISTLFKSSSAVDAVVNAGDALVFTDEERKAMHTEQLKAYTPFKVAQRYLMLIVCVPYVVMSTVIFICLMLGIGHVKEAIDVLTGPLGLGFAAIVAFYTGGGAVEGIMGKRK